VEKRSFSKGLSKKVGPKAQIKEKQTIEKRRRFQTTANLMKL
jgi:hypothetical protein